MTTLHLLGSPTLPVYIENRTDAFGIAIIKFIENMTKRGWNCIHYGVEGCKVDCETVICGPGSPSDTDQECKHAYNDVAAIEIAKRKKPGDLILCFYGWDNKTAAEANRDLKIIEPGIGYSTKACFAPYKVFTSYAQMHLYYGAADMLLNPSWFDTVIPNGFTPSEFEFNVDKEDYVLYFGRVMHLKGLDVAIQATERSGDKLIVAGKGSLRDLGYKEIPSHVEVVGVCDVDQRRNLMKNAKAIIGPTYYIEPFGNMVVEGYFSGTPAITTDWGGFVDTVVQGKTGFRCREMREFVDALKHIKYIDPYDCRKYAMSNYTEDKVHDQFHSYFLKVIESDFYRP